MISRDAYEEMQSLLDNLRQQRASVREQMDELERRINILEPAVSLVATMLKPESTQQPKLLRNTIVLLFQSTRRPLHYKVICDRLIDQGIEVNGVDPARTVNAHLSNDERFVRLGKGYWGLASWPKSLLVIPDEDEDTEHSQRPPVVSRQSGLLRLSNGGFDTSEDSDDVPF